MDLRFYEEFKSEETGYSSKTYKADDTVQQENFCDLLKSFEDDSTRFYYCTCNTYNENGSPISPTFKDLEKMRARDFDNPDVSFMANFIDRETQEYKFSVCSSINSDMVDIVSDPKMAHNVKHKLDVDKQFEELKSKSDERHTD